MEVFKDIIGYEGLYQVSDHGNIKSLERPHHFRGIKKEKLLKCGILKNGYCVVILCKNANIKTYFIHRLVLQTFYPINNTNLEVNHIDGNKTNNNLLNLEWCSHENNIKHAVQTNLNNNKGEKNPLAKLTKKDVLEIRELLKTNMLQKDIAKKYNVTWATISDIKHKKRWKHV